MTTRVALVSCVKSKRTSVSPAGDLYTSQLFRALRAHAVAHADSWYVLSAEHGLLRPDQMVAPYERTLSAMPKRDRAAWAERVQGQLLEVLPTGAEVILLAGTRYREGLVPFLRARGFSVSVPLEGLGIGKQLQKLKQVVRRDSMHDDLERLYALLARLEEQPGQGRRLAEHHGRAAWPERGVYFFREPGESRATRPGVSRVVRVGTHAVSASSKSTLWDRLRTHRGGRTGGGNHRGSIFRLHVGAAMLARDGSELPTWGVGSSAPKSIRVDEADHERRVSTYIGAMSALWVEVPDAPSPESARAYVERNAIALLSNELSPVDQPSTDWLGLRSPREEIRRSGIWNLSHVGRRYEPEFLDVLESFVTRACSR